MMCEYHFARDSPFDGITAVRALAGLSLSDVDAAFIVTWMKFCQSVNANASFLSQCHVSPNSQKCFTLPHIVQVQMVMLEVKCGVRKGGTLTNINWGKGRYDVGLRLKAVLVKRDLMIHLKKTYSHSVVVSLINHFQPFLEI